MLFGELTLLVPCKKRACFAESEQDWKECSTSSPWLWVQSSQSCARMLMDRWAPQADGKTPYLAFICLSPDSSSLGCGKGFRIRLPKLAAEQQAERVLEMIQKKRI